MTKGQLSTAEARCRPSGKTPGDRHPAHNPRLRRASRARNDQDQHGGAHGQIPVSGALHERRREGFAVRWRRGAPHGRRKRCASVGGKLDAFYFAFGDVDAYVICDLPDDVSAAALAMTVSASGRASTTTVKLLMPEDVDQAAKKVVAYRAPGG